jgi:hypothetical protein
LKDAKKDLNFIDVKDGDWYYDYVNYAIKNDLIKTNSVNFFPSKPLTREELVSILYKFIKK